MIIFVEVLLAVIGLLGFSFLVWIFYTFFPTQKFVSSSKSGLVHWFVFQKIQKDQNRRALIEGLSTNPHLTAKNFVTLYSIIQSWERSSVDAKAMLADNVATPIDILFLLAESTEDNYWGNAWTVRAKLLGNKKIPTENRTAWALRWGTI